MSKLIGKDQWVWVVVQDPGGDEQFLGQYDHRTDIFQIASVMYYAFTGKLAFLGDSEHEIMHLSLIHI